MNNAPGVQYLLRSSYRVEAHLSKQYHTDHDELVLAHLIADDRAAQQEIVRPINAFDQFAIVDSVSAPVVAICREQFGEHYFYMPDSWFVNQVQSAVDCSRGGGSQFRRRLMFSAATAPSATVVDTNERLQAVAWCGPNAVVAPKYYLNAVWSSSQPGEIREIH